MAEVAEAPARNSLYETDFHEWALQQARLLRERRWADLDLENLVEEVEDVGLGEKKEIGNRLTVILEHLLKWEHQPEKRKYGWRSTLFEQRVSIDTVLDYSPSLHREPAARLARAYRIARIRAATDTGLRESMFPQECPYRLDEVLDVGFLPGRPETEIV